MISVLTSVAITYNKESHDTVSYVDGGGDILNVIKDLDSREMQLYSKSSKQK